MSTALGIDVDQQIWGTFSTLKEHLYDQFQNISFDPETGLPLAELERQVDAYLRAHPDQPRILQKAHAYRLVVTRGQIALDPLDWYADKLNHGNLVRKLRNGWHREAQENSLETEAGWFRQADELGAVRGGLDMGHISPGWENMFSGGLEELIDRARHRRQQPETTAEQRTFCEAVEIVYQATIQLAERFADLAGKMLIDHPEHRVRLGTIADVCRQVPARAPENFHQALQFAWFMHEMIEMEGEMVRSMGHFDRTLYPYYLADIDTGRLTPEQAKDLIQFLWIKYHARTRGKSNGKNFVFAGQDADGTPIANELTYLALDTYEELNTPDPKLSIRFTPDTPKSLYRRVADLIRCGHNSFVLMNDQPAVEAMVKRGKSLEDARTYLPIGCYEPAVDGKETGCTMNLVVSLAKALELTLNDGVDPLSGQQFGPCTGNPRQFADFERLFAAFTAQLDFLLAQSIEYVRAHERQWPQINPSPLIAGTIDDCLSLGKDVGQGGAHYNSVGCVGVGLANACDSLLAMRQTVFEERRFAIDEILDAIQNDFEDRESMRQSLRTTLAFLHRNTLIFFTISTR